MSEKDKWKNSAKLTPANDLFGQILAWHRMLALSILASLISINEVAMTRHDQQILFTALAFLAVVQKDGEKATEGSAQKVMMLAKLLGELGQTCDNRAIAAHYTGLLDHLLIDHCDAPDAEGLREMGVSVTITATVMCTAEDRKGLARDAKSSPAHGYRQCASGPPDHVDHHHHGAVGKQRAIQGTICASSCPQAARTKAA